MPAPDRPPRRRFVPGCEPLDRRDLPAVLDVAAVAWGLYEIYCSSPIKAARSVALGGKLVRLAWTGKAKFAFGLIRLSHPHPLGAKPHIRKLVRRSSKTIRLAATRCGPRILPRPKPGPPGETG